jgi:AraC-like DNA-binding protein
MLGCIRGATLTGYPDLARSLGLDPRRLMAEVGLDFADLAVPDKWIPAAPAARLLELSARRSGREDFALLLTEYRGLATLGPLSVVVQQEPDLRAALRLFVDYVHVYTGVLDLRLIEGDNRATLQFWLKLGEPAPLRQALDVVTGSATGVIRALVRSDWQPLSVYFAHPAPADLATYRRIFGPGLTFDHEFTGLRLPARDLDAPIAAADAALRPYTQLFWQTIAPPRPTTPVDQVGELAEVLLPLGRCSLPEVSRALGLEPRTLRRRLADRGQTFTSVVNATRMRLAERYLANERYSLTAVSGLLGFAAPGAFTRWFHEQAGISPSQWRTSVCAAAEAGGAKG